MKKLIQLYVSWFKMGLFTFGGGYAMLPMIQKEVIEKYHWATEDEVRTIMRLVNVHPVLLRSIHRHLLDIIKPAFQVRLQLL